MPIKHLLVHMNATATAVCSCYDNKLFAKLRIVSSCSYYQSCSMCIGCPNCSEYHSECSQTAEILHGGWGCIRPVPYMKRFSSWYSWSLAHAFVAALARKWLYHFKHTFDFSVASSHLKTLLHAWSAYHTKWEINSSGRSYVSMRRHCCNSWKLYYNLRRLNGCRVKAS